MIPLAFALVIGGCGHGPNDGVKPHAVMVVAVDRSVQGADARADQITELNGIAKAASDAHYLLDIWLYGERPLRVWGPDQIMLSDQLETIEDRSLPPYPASPKRVARPDRLIEEIAADKKDSGMTYGRIVILTDGAATPSAQAIANLKFAAAPLASRPDWRVEVLGMDPANKTVWDSSVGAELGSRLSTTSAADAIGVLKSFRDD